MRLFDSQPFQKMQESALADAMPHGRTLDMDFMFTKLRVDDLDATAAFYTNVCGLVEMHRVEAKIAGRAVSEIVYQPTVSGGPMFVLVKFHDAPPSGNDEVMLGFSTKDLDAFVERLKAAGGSVLEQTQDDYFRHAFAQDVEGHQLQVTQLRG